MHVIVGDLTPKHVILFYLVLFKCFIYYVGIVWEFNYGTYLCAHKKLIENLTFIRLDPS
jgi:hypothetical protein